SRPRLDVPPDAGHARLQEVDPGEDQPEARQDRPERARLAASDQPEEGANAEDGKGRGGNPQTKSQDRYHPGRRRRSERGAHVDRDRLGEGDQPRADEADNGEDCRGGRLRHNREERAGGDGAVAGGNEPLERATQRVARKTLETFGEVVDSEQEQPDSTRELYDDRGAHGITSVGRFRASKSYVAPAAGAAGRGAPPRRRSSIETTPA